MTISWALSSGTQGGVCAWELDMLIEREAISERTRVELSEARGRSSEMVAGYKTGDLRRML